MLVQAGRQERANGQKKEPVRAQARAQNRWQENGTEGGCRQVDKDLVGRL